jgi:hypothetical protein
MCLACSPAPCSVGLGGNNGEDFDPDDSSYLKSAADSKAHDELVRILINRTIDDCSVTDQTNPNPAVFRKKSVIDVLTICHSQMTNKRDEDVMNTVVRDAEYYFANRVAVAAHTSDIGKRYSSLFWTEAATWYDRGKKVTRAMHSHLLESKDHKPNSEPGGARWALRGVADGKRDDPNEVARPYVADGKADVTEPMERPRHCVLTPYYDETAPP